MASAHSKSRANITRPLWTCPKCLHRFVARNMWHSCDAYPLSHHFKGKDPIVRELFDGYLRWSKTSAR